MFNQNIELSGISSVDTAVPAAGPYFAKGKLSIPRPSQGDAQASSAVVTITNRTGPVTLYTGTAGADGFRVDTLCAAGDIIRIAITSANSEDTALNAVKTQIQIGSGQ